MTRIVCRVALLAPLVAMGLGATSSVARIGPAAPLCAQAAASHRVGLVVEHANGQVIRRCIGFAGPTITAVAVLQASGLEIGVDTYGSLGAAVCQIDREPTGYTTCLPASGSYWVLFASHGGGAWVTSATGASSTYLSGGDVVGFRYDPVGGADPPPANAGGTCPPAAPATAPPSSRPSGSTPATGQITPQPPRPTSTAARPPTSAVRGTSPTSGPAQARARSATAVASNAGARVNVGLLAAVSAIGGLFGLLGAQALRRRRR